MASSPRRAEHRVMPRPTRYEIEIRGRADERILRPVVDDFRIETTDHGTTRIVGDVCDASHLNGLLAHFTSMNVELVELRRIDDAIQTPSIPQPQFPTHPPLRREETTHDHLHTHPPSDADRDHGRTPPDRRRRSAARRRHVRLRHRHVRHDASPTTPTPTRPRPSRSTFSSTTRAQLLAWYIGIFIVFGAALVPMGTCAAPALRRPGADPREHRHRVRRDLGRR